MQGSLQLLTFDCVIRRAFIGVAVGYTLRVIEHFLWSFVHTPARDSVRGAIAFTLTILPQSVLFGAALGYAALAAITWFTNSEAALGICAYLFPALASFLAVDLRELLRRMTRL